MKITKVIIPAAGWGTRFLPFTKAVPKEMVPLLNKPAIQYIVQEAVDSGIDNCIVITSAHKQALINYFNPQPALETFLKEKNKLSLLTELHNLCNSITLTFIMQDTALGLGHAVGLAKNNITDDYCAVMLPDDIMASTPPALAQLITIAQKYTANVIAVQEVPDNAVSSYGIVALKNEIEPGVFEIQGVVEKPTATNAPSRLAIIGRYILSQKIFKKLDELKPAANGEIQLTDAIASLIAGGQKVIAYKVQGLRYDVGTPHGWLLANRDMARNNPTFSDIFE
jgi:UTP--glucose-1-phosphate uridylyltransferase